MLKSNNLLNNNNNHFIDGWYIDESLCDDLIDFFEKSNDDEKRVGKVYKNNTPPIVDKSVKDSTDFYVAPYNKHPLIQKFLGSLEEVLNEYKTKYTYCDTGVTQWRISKTYNIQRYFPNQGFHKFHCERGTEGTYKRHLVWMTFLNDINDGGETEWFYQKVKVKPEKGLTLIWPTDWTYTHRGLVSKTETKYIITGWYDFYESE